MKIKWLHLSDLHFNFKNYDSRLLRSDFIERIKDLSESERFTHLFLSGDILYRNGANLAEAKETVQFLRDLISAMKINISNVFLVPGNHDHDRNIASKHLADIYQIDDDNVDIQIDELPDSAREDLLSAFANFNTVYQDLFSEPYYNGTAKPHVITSSEGVSVIKLNTAWLDIDSNMSESLRFGHNELLTELEQSKRTLKDNLCIAIGHHPIESFSCSEQKKLMDLFGRYNIHLYLCGHNHRPSIKQYYQNDVIELVCSGGLVDGYSVGGYSYGIIDTGVDFYKSEFYSWIDGNWHIESALDGTNEFGIFYFNSPSFKHNPNISAIDFKLMGSRLSDSEISKALNTDHYDLFVHPQGHIDPASISASDWTGQQSLIRDLSSTIQYLVEKNNAVHLFPVAPIPLLIELGFQLQKGSRIFVHQYNRENASWVQSETDEGIVAKIDEVFSGNNELVVMISTSAVIDDAMVFRSVSRRKCDVLRITASKIQLGSPLYGPDIDRVTTTIFAKLTPIASQYEKIHLFAAVPAGMAIEIGRNLQKTIFGNVYTYHLFGREYHRAIIINPLPSTEGERNQTESNIVEITEYANMNKGIPIVGKIACGEITDAILESGESFPVPESVLGTGKYFALIASGDSMINAGIEDGDYVLVRQQESADDGQIVAARVDNQTTLKRLHLDVKHKKVILHSENDMYEDQIFDEVEIQGVAKMVIKSLQ